jgi:hypothetical protein
MTTGAAKFYAQALEVEGWANQLRAVSGWSDEDVKDLMAHASVFLVRTPTVLSMAGILKIARDMFVYEGEITREQMITALQSDRWWKAFAGPRGGVVFVEYGVRQMGWWEQA